MSTWYKEDGTTNYSIQVDYVAGLVAKATIEAAEYYKNFDWSKPWFKSVEWYGNKCTVPTSPANLDAINASKMYFGIYNLANGTFKDDAGSNTASYATKQLGNALTALSNYNNNYAFAAGTTLNSVDIAGGWYHKSTYPKQMWLDGQYMGPATLAQLINGYSSYSSNKLTDNDWNLITKQFTIVWEQCWDSNEKLLYHAFSSEKLSYWTSEPEIWTTAQADKTKWTSMTAAGHSAAFWGRAEGWYFLALVDVLEEMQKANLTNSDNYSTLLGYLVDLAAGIKDRQDGTTGCWYQLVGKEGSYKASYYNGNSANEKSNYLESSCTAIFTAAYLKAIRLGLLEKDTYFSIAEKAYKGMVKQFMKQREDGTVDLLGCCKSAGVGTATIGNERFRDGSNAYYLHGYDVTPTSTNSGDYYTEGKVLGAFILAATEYERQYQSPMLLSNDLNSKYTLSSNESLSAEVLGEGTATYQWFDATGTTPSAITGATNASYTPTKSGKYYCVITVTPTSTAAKTRAASTEPYTITTSTADVTVEATGTENGGETGDGSLLVTLPTTETTEITCNGTAAMVNNSDYVMYKEYCYEIASGKSCTLTIPSGVTVTKIEIIGTSNNNKSKSTITISDCTPTNGGELNTRKDTENGKSTLTFIPTSQKSTYTIKSSTKASLIQIKVYGTTGPLLTISTQPQSADYVTGATANPLTVVATLDGYTLSYQWYESNTNSNTGGTKISGATAASYTPTLPSTAGTTYYYCVVTATKEGSETLTATSDVAAITVSEPYIKFTTQPKSGSYAINVAPSALTVVAATNLGVEPTYQWYSNSSATAEGTEIKGATNASYTPSTSTVGTTYYYCIATAKRMGQRLPPHQTSFLSLSQQPFILIKLNLAKLLQESIHQSISLTTTRISL